MTIDAATIVAFRPSEDALTPAQEPAADLDRPFKLPRLSVVIPTLNEALNLPAVFQRMPSWVYEVIIVDGHSTDNTPAVAKSLWPEVLIICESKRGKGAALRAGFMAASGDIIAAIDGDGSMDPAELLLFVAALVSGADYAKGSRFIQGGGTEDMSAVRMLGNWGLTQLVRVLHGSGFSDLCYGYNAFWRRHLPLLDTSASGFEIETALNLSALNSGLHVVEVPSFEKSRIHGQSNLSAVRDGLRVVAAIFKALLRGRSAPRVVVARAGRAYGS